MPPNPGKRNVQSLYGVKLWIVKLLEMHGLKTLGVLRVSVGKTGATVKSVVEPNEQRISADI